MWNKETRQDDFFGSTGSGKSILEVMKEEEQKQNQDQTNFNDAFMEAEETIKEEGIFSENPGLATTTSTDLFSEKTAEMMDSSQTVKSADTFKSTSANSSRKKCM